MRFEPTAPCGDLRRKQEELNPFAFTENGPPPWLRPGRSRRVVKPRHGAHKERAGIPEYFGFAVDAPVVHETGVANRSPSDQDRDARQFIVYHLAMTQHCDWIGFGFTLKGDAQD